MLSPDLQRIIRRSQGLLSVLFRIQSPVSAIRRMAFC